MALEVQYNWPVATPGTTTPPAANSAPPTNPAPPATVRFNEVVAALTGDGASTSVTITHNLGITAQELTQDWPEVKNEPQVSGAPSIWTIARAANTVTIGLSATVATSVGVFTLIRITRPQSATR
jgi:hypothetical protein